MLYLGGTTNFSVGTGGVQAINLRGSEKKNTGALVNEEDGFQVYLVLLSWT